MDDCYPAELETMTAVIAAILGPDGVLRHGNAGFRRIAAPDGDDPTGTDVSHLLIQPDFATLRRAVEASPEDAYTGRLTMGHVNGVTRTLRAQVRGCADGLCLLAEYDVEDLERVGDAFRKLNGEHELLQFQLVQANQQLRQQRAEIEAISLTDPLTGLGNRRQLDATFAFEIKRMGRTGAPLTAIMADLDHFKTVNDRFGHAAGDLVLEAFGDIMRAQAREIDLVARFGGEEFVVLLPDTTLDDGRAIAERMRSSLAASVIAPLKAPVTASFGVAQAADAETAGSLLQRIDRALYKAKESGRNCVVAG